MRNIIKRAVLLILVLALCMGMCPPVTVSAAGDALSTSEVKALLNSVELYPQRTGYQEIDQILEDIIAPYADSDTYTKIKVMYDWTVRNIDYSWEGYSKTVAPAYDCFTLTYDLTYDEGLLEAIPREIIDRSYHTLTAHKGVCYDWAAVFAIMARYVGIEAYVHTGQFQFETGYGTGAGHHGWAELCIDGQNYIFDPQREYRLSANGTGTISYLYFGIPYANAWRYEQETDANEARDAGFLPVDAERYYQFNITAFSSHSGSVTGAGTYRQGAEVTLSAVSDVPLEGWFEKDGTLLSEEPTYTFTAEKNLTVYALFSGDHFCDISADAWYLEDVMAAAERNIVNGMTPIIFDGSGKLSRAMVVRFLANADGADLEQSYDCPFTDLQEGRWYTAAVGWAWENGLVNGIGDDKFAPDSNVTREQFITILVRYLESKGVSPECGELPYSDTVSISAYARESMEKAQALGLIVGYSDGTLQPRRDLTRAEGVTLIMRTLNILEDTPEDSETPEPEDPTVPDETEPIETPEPEVPVSPENP